MKSDDSKQKLQTLLTSFEEDMKLIFFLTISMLIIDVINGTDIAFIKNVYNLDLGIIKITSLKGYIINYIISMESCLSFYAFYDLMQATFKILRNSFEK